MLHFATWHNRIAKAWRKKVKRKKKKLVLDPHPPRESTVRWQDGKQVMLMIWDTRHTWAVFDEHRNPLLVVRCDEPISVDALFSWLGKTTPVE